MKKLLLISGLTFLCGANIRSQTQNDIIGPSIFSIGPKGAFAHSFIMPDKNWQFFPGWNAGISAIYSPQQSWGIGLDAVYSFEGGKTKQEMNGKLEFERNLEYIRVPVKGILFFGAYENDFRPKISLGPSFAFLVNDKNELQPSAEAEPFDLGGELAVGFNSRLAEAIWLNVDIAYTQGFLDVYKDVKDNQYNGNIALNAAILFGLGD